MRRFLIGLAAIAAAESVALACSCIAPGTPEESRTLAREETRRALAIVEADVLSEYRQGGAGEQVRVRRTLWGRAPSSFRIDRREFASSASCDLLLQRGQRKVLILYPAEDRRHVGRRFRIQSLCSDFLTSNRGFLAVTLQEARRRR